MSLTQHPQETPPAPSSPALEAGLRLALVSVVTLVGGLALGGWTFHELTTRGTGWFVGAVAGAVLLSALAWYRWGWCAAGFMSLLWLSVGRAPDMAQGVSSGTGKSLYPVELALTFLFVMALLKRFPRQRTPLDGPLIVYLIFCAWTAWNGALFWDGALARFDAGQQNGGRTPLAVTLVELCLRAWSAGAFWWAGTAIRNGRTLRRVSWVVLAPGALVGLSFLRVLPGLPVVWGQLLELGTACALFAWLLETANSDARTRRLRIGAWAGLALLTFTVFYVGLSWISGWLGLAAGLLTVAALRGRRALTGTLTAFVVAAVCALPVLGRHVAKDVTTSGDLDRFQLLRGDLLYALHFPLGVGVGNFRAYNLYYGGQREWGTTTYTSAHNFYGQALAEMGFGGLIVVLIVVFSALFMLARWYKRMTPGFGRTFVLATAGWWAGVCGASVAGDYLVPVYHNGGLLSLSTTVYVWLALGLAAGHAREADAL